MARITWGLHSTAQPLGEARNDLRMLYTSAACMIGSAFAADLYIGSVFQRFSGRVFSSTHSVLLVVHSVKPS